MQTPRKIYFIEKSFQGRFILKFASIVVISSCIMALVVLLLSKRFTTIAIENAHVMVKSTADFIFPLLVLTILIVTAFSAVAVTILTLLMSHKIAGPIYRLQKEIKLLGTGDLNPNFKIRRHDQLQELARALSEAAEAIKIKHFDLKNKVNQLKDGIENNAADKNTLKNKLREIEDIVNYFKV